MSKIVLLLTVSALMVMYVGADYDTAINAVTTACQNQVTKCLNDAPQDVKYYYNTMKYCDAITYSSSSFTSKTCLVTNGGCTNAEYDGVKIAVCGATTLAVGDDYNTAINAVTATCQGKINTCLNAAPNDVKQYYNAMKYCDAITYSSSSFTSKTCLVTSGGCSNAEYDVVKIAVCGTTTLAVGDDYNTAINAVTTACRNQVTKCLNDAPNDVKQYYNAMKYCDAITYSSSSFTSKTCLVTSGGCSNAEYDGVKNAVCGATTLVVGAATFVFTLILLLDY